MTIDKIISARSLSEWIANFGWQGGTIHQVKQEIINRLNKAGIKENYNRNKWYNNKGYKIN